MDDLLDDFIARANQRLASDKSRSWDLLPVPVPVAERPVEELDATLLMAEELGVAGIAIDSAPPKGLISLKWSFLKSNWPVLSPTADIAVPITMSFEQFQYAFTNGMGEAEQRAAYDKYIVPESRRVGKGPTTDVAAIDFSRPRPPLLLIAGDSDHIIPASLNFSNFHLYDKTPALTEYREFAGRNHWLIADSGWQEIATYVLDWLHANGQPEAQPAKVDTQN